MAQRTVVSLIDDLDGESEADETVEYALDGVTYEMDLSSDHAERLREVFAPYVAAARRTSGRTRSGTSSRRSSSGGGGGASSAGGRGRQALKAIRDWAKSSGWAVSDRGRLPNNVVEAYDAAHK
ncbi:histone-like nucleoid-structuring protein Lsr2 [Actinomycetospora sp. CA-101289]|uniref:histone-like nucleoid-structuring protein Lsr2 n=1 Tax=Actinomycetospora sp. CA-101289 TaxID=3239893 RepID=UPI003D995997